MGIRNTISVIIRIIKTRILKIPNIKERKANVDTPLSKPEKTKETFNSNLVFIENNMIKYYSVHLFSKSRQILVPGLTRPQRLIGINRVFKKNCMPYWKPRKKREYFIFLFHLNEIIFNSIRSMGFNITTRNVCNITVENCTSSNPLKKE